MGLPSPCPTKTSPFYLGFAPSLDTLTLDTWDSLSSDANLSCFLSQQPNQSLASRAETLRIWQTCSESPTRCSTAGLLFSQPPPPSSQSGSALPCLSGTRL